MATFRQAQTGNRVYRGNSQSPNRGQVSGKGAQGYLQRELRKKGPVTPVGRDGKSDSRSGVAAAALRRTGASFGSQAVARGEGNKSKQPPRNLPGRTPQQAGGGAPAISGGSGAPAPAPAPQQITTHSNGVLELPYDQSYSAEQFALIGQANQDLLDLQMEEQNADLDFASQTREANIANESLKKQMLSAAGGRGTVFSSQYGNQVTDAATQYSNLIADLTGRNAMAKSGFAQRRAAIQGSLNQQLAALTQQYADEAAANAGDLGYDTTTEYDPNAGLVPGSEGFDANWDAYAAADWQANTGNKKNKNKNKFEGKGPGGKTAVAQGPKKKGKK